MRKKQKLVFIIIGFHWLSTAIEIQIQNCNNDDVIWLKIPVENNKELIQNINKNIMLYLQTKVNITFESLYQICKGVN